MLFRTITITLVFVLFLYMLVIRSTPKPLYYPVTIPNTENTKAKEASVEETSEKEQMFQTYFPNIKDSIELDYPLKPIGCCPPSKDMSKDLPIGNIPICYAADSKTYLR